MDARVPFTKHSVMIHTQSDDDEGPPSTFDPNSPIMLLKIFTYLIICCENKIKKICVLYLLPFNLLLLFITYLLNM